MTLDDIAKMKKEVLSPAEVARLTRERDAAVRDIVDAYATDCICAYCKFSDSPVFACANRSESTNGECWEWRGVVAENSGEGATKGGKHDD